jgi:hypothetical protein
MPPNAQLRSIGIKHRKTLSFGVLRAYADSTLLKNPLPARDAFEPVAHSFRRADTRRVQRVRLPFHAAESQARRQWVQTLLQQQAVRVGADEGSLEPWEDDDLEKNIRSDLGR